MRWVFARDNGNYGESFLSALKSLGIEGLRTAPHSPWQNPFVERIIGSIRRECSDHLIVFNERRLHRILSSYFDDYHRSRIHLSLDKDPPETRSVDSPEKGEVRAVAQVGGLHHRYTRTAA